MALEVLIVDDEQDICCLIQDVLEDEGYACRLAHSGEGALEEVRKRRPHLVLLDIWLGDTRFDGLRVLEEIRKAHSDLPVLMMSGHGNIETAVSAIKRGAYDFLEKPFKSDRLLVLIERAIEATRLREENLILLRQLEPSAATHDVIGNSSAILSLREAINKQAQTNARVLIQGPFGSGKEAVARLIHTNSQRAQGPFVVMNCYGLNAFEVERELFGSEREGHFHVGVFERAHLGTLYLDSVDELDGAVQLKIARALQRQRFLRDGGEKEIEADFRVISSATNDLKQLLEQDRLKEEFYNRISAATLKVPGLKERREDIAEIVDNFLEFFALQHQLPKLEVSQEVLVLLQSQAWPGDVKQLRNLLEWVTLNFSARLEKGNTITLQDLPLSLLHSSHAANDSSMIMDFIQLPLREARDRFERDYLAAQIDRFEGNISKTASFVGMERSALHRKLRALAIK